MSMSANIHGVTGAGHNRLPDVKNDGIEFRNDDRNAVNIFVPPHVAAATVKAFNRAMQVTSTKNGLVYNAASGSWNVDQISSKIWHGQSDEITGDDDPSWMTVTAKTLEGLQDAIDDIIADNSCTDCHAFVGEDNTAPVGDGYLCRDCLVAAGKEMAAMREMADDDKAHAYAEREAGL